MPKINYSFIDQYGILHVAGDELTDEELAVLKPTDPKTLTKGTTKPKEEKQVPPGMVRVPYSFIKSFILYPEGAIVTKAEWDALQPLPPKVSQPWEVEPRPVALWNKQDVAVLKAIRKLMGLTAEQCDPYIQDWSKGRLTNFKDITQENIKAFIKYLKGKAIELCGKDAVETVLNETIKGINQ